MPTIVAPSRVTMVGTLLNHDTFQVLMRDTKDQLRSFQKADLREHGFVEGSAMPSYRDDALSAGARGCQSPI